MPQRPNGIDQTNRVYGSRKELLSPAWQLINELIRRWGAWGKGAGLPAKLGVLGSQLPVGASRMSRSPIHRTSQPLSSL